MKDKSFAIVGGGIGGLTTAIALQKKGFTVNVYEGAPELRPVGAGLILAANAIRALMDIGVAEAVIPRGKALNSMRILNVRGKPLAATNAIEMSRKLGVVNSFAIHRADLHAILAEHLSPGTIRLSKTCVNAEQDNSGVTITFSDGTTERADYLIAADGIHSVIRKKYLPESLPRYSGYTCWRGVADDIPDGVDMDTSTETWGRGKRFGIVPLAGNRVYWFATLNAPQADPRMRAITKGDLVNLFSDFHFPVTDIINSTPEDRLIWADIIDLKPLTRFAFGRVLLLGDAAHATTPNMGQGACMATEDAAILANTLAAQTSPEEAFIAFERKRIPRTTKIVNDSLRLGRMIQLENPLLTTARNTIVRLTPPRVTENLLRYLADVSLS